MPRSAGCLLLLAVLGSAGAAGQSTDEINASLQFNFSNPGARSLGLAGAFTARADDATAVFANPAGLIQLTQPELSIDLRQWDVTNPFLSGDAPLGAPSRFAFDETDDSSRGLSFLSAFYPGRSGRWVAGVFRHESANFETRVRSDGIAIDPSRSGQCLNSAEIRPLDGFYALDVESFGASMAARTGTRLSLGATLSFVRFDLASRTERLNKIRSEVGCSPPAPIREDSPFCCDFGNQPEDVLRFQTMTTDPERNDAFAYTLGLLWQSAREVQGFPVLSVGAVYRKGPEFGFLADAFFRSSAVPYFYTSLRIDRDTSDDCNVEGRDACPGNFKIPDVAGIGISLRPSLKWVIALDYNRVEYSDLSDQLLDISRADPQLTDGGRGRSEIFTIDDGDEIRLGVEYALLREIRLPDIFLRGGAWFESDHKLRYTGDEPRFRAIWLPGADQIHLAAGVGLRYRAFQLDAGLDIADTITTLSVAAVYYFGRR